MSSVYLSENMLKKRALSGVYLGVTVIKQRPRRAFILVRILSNVQKEHLFEL